jgi:hypothetical protein
MTARKPTTSRDAAGGAHEAHRATPGWALGLWWLAFVTGIGGSGCPADLRQILRRDQRTGLGRRPARHPWRPGSFTSLTCLALAVAHRRKRNSR